MKRNTRWYLSAAAAGALLAGAALWAARTFLAASAAVPGFFGLAGGLLFICAMAELLSTLDGCVYAERVCVTDIANINKAKKAIKQAFQKQMNGEGFTFIEVLSTCPTNWGMTPLKANQWLKDNMVPYYPLGVIKETAPEGAEVK